ncbi:MAG: alkaline phosphatase D family protein [Casimicrobiaceae bacterium]
MSTTTDRPDGDADVTFRAQICWLGPIMGAPEESEEAGKVRIAGAEDPALGKSFVVALLPVKEIDGYFRELQPNKERVVLARLTDRHGWFAIDAPTDLWQDPAEGVLVVLLYNESKDLKYYTYNDYKPTHKAVSKAQLGATHAFLSTEKILDPMPQSVRDKIEDAIGNAIGELLKSPAKELRKGLAELRPTPKPASGADRDANAELVFAVASCQYPSAMLEDAVAGASYGRLADWVSGKKYRRPQFLLLVGDQIYVDGTAGLFDPTSQFDRFVRPYEILYRMNPVRDVLRRLPAYMMMDDHEIRDNWESRVDDTRPDREMMEGRRSYLKFQRRAGPPQVDPVGDSNHPIWFDIKRNRFGVFMADTRTEREMRTARHVAPAHIMSDAQMEKLLAWLGDEKYADMPKVVATPSILMPRHSRALQGDKVVSALRSDGWDGYPHSLYQILTHIAREKIRNVVFVSGDEHLACVARVEVATADGEPVVFHSVHSSPLFAPFPFANSVREDLVAREEFDFHPARDRDDGTGDDHDDNGDGGGADQGGGRRFRCRVDTEFAAPGDGFAVIRFYLKGGAWMMQCDFDRAGKPEGSSRIRRALS